MGRLGDVGATPPVQSGCRLRRRWGTNDGPLVTERPTLGRQRRRSVGPPPSTRQRRQAASPGRIWTRLGRGSWRDGHVGRVLGLDVAPLAQQLSQQTSGDRSPLSDCPCRRFAAPMGFTPTMGWDGRQSWGEGVSQLVHRTQKKQNHQMGGQAHRDRRHQQFFGTLATAITTIAYSYYTQ